MRKLVGAALIAVTLLASAPQASAGGMYLIVRQRHHLVAGGPVAIRDPFPIWWTQHPDRVRLICRTKGGTQVGQRAAAGLSRFTLPFAGTCAANLKHYSFGGWHRVYSTAFVVRSPK